jgi:hypothetical protein
MFVVIRARCLLVCSALLLFAFANAASAGDGAYQRTKDGKTLVWNSYPNSDGSEAVEWSGQQDKEGYATGYGTVTWYKVDDSKYTFVKRTKLVVAGRYSGNMVRGKLEGTVMREDSIRLIRWNTDPPPKVHATFVGGNRTGDWVAGPTPSVAPAAAPSPTPGQPAKEKVSAPAKEG